MSSRSRQRKKVSPFCLNHLFPQSCSLHQFLSRVGGEKFKTLPYHNKFQDIIDSVWILPKDEDIATSGQWSEKLRPVEDVQNVSISQIINVAVAQMIRSSSSSTMQNVLCYGYRQKSMNSDDASVRNWLDLECRFVNTVQSMLMTISWKHLAAAIGTDCFRQLLDYPMFLTSSNGSYLQICGPPANALANKLNGVTNSKLKDDAKLLRFQIFYNTSPFRTLLPPSHSLLKTNENHLFLEIFGPAPANQHIPAASTSELSSNTVTSKQEIHLKAFCRLLQESITCCDGQTAMRLFIQRKDSSTSTNNPKKGTCRTSDDECQEEDEINSTSSSSSSNSGTQSSGERIPKVGGNKRKRATRRGCRSGKQTKRKKLEEEDATNQVKSSAYTDEAVLVGRLGGLHRNKTFSRTTVSNNNQQSKLFVQPSAAGNSHPTISYAEYLTKSISTNVMIDKSHANFQTQEEDMPINRAKSLPIIKMSQNIIHSAGDNSSSNTTVNCMKQPPVSSASKSAIHSVHKNSSNPYSVFLTPCDVLVDPLPLTNQSKASEDRNVVASTSSAAAAPATAAPPLSVRNKKSKWRKKWRKLLYIKSKADLQLTQGNDILADQLITACEEHADYLRLQLQEDCGRNHHINRAYRPTVLLKDFNKLASSAETKAATSKGENTRIHSTTEKKSSSFHENHNNEDSNCNEEGDQEEYFTAAANKASSTLPHKAEPAALAIDQVKETVDFSIPKMDVANYVKAIVRRFLPISLCWGSRHNLHVIMRQIDSFVHLGRHESLTLTQIMQHLRVDDFPWLHVLKSSNGAHPTNNNTSDNHATNTHNNYSIRHKYAGKFMLWLFNRFISLVIAQAFYVTEAEGHGADVFYFQKHVWRKIVHKHFPEFQDRFVAVDPFATTAANSSTDNTTINANNAFTSTASSSNHTTGYYNLSGGGIAIGELQRSVSAPTPTSSSVPRPYNKIINNSKSSTNNVGKKVSSSLFNSSIRQNTSSSSSNGGLNTGSTTKMPNSSATNTTTFDNSSYQQQRVSYLQSWSLKVAESSHLAKSLTVEQWQENKRMQKKVLAVKAKQFSTIRFVPKKTGLRGITNLRTKVNNYTSMYANKQRTNNTNNTANNSGNTSNHAAANNNNNNSNTPIIVTNTMLYNCLHVLKHLYDTDEQLRGFGVFGTDDIYREYRSYWNRLADIYGPDALQQGQVPLYMAAADLEKCYDNIDPVRLYDLVQELLLGKQQQPVVSTSSIMNNTTANSSLIPSLWPSQTLPLSQPNTLQHPMSSSTAGAMSRTTSATSATSAANTAAAAVTTHMGVPLSRTGSAQPTSDTTTTTALLNSSVSSQQAPSSLLLSSQPPSSSSAAAAAAAAVGKLTQPCLIHKYAVTHTMRSMERVVTKHLKYCVLSGDTIPFADAGPEIAKRYRNSVIYDAVVYSKITAQEIMKILRHHLFSQIVKMPSTLLDPQQHSPYCMQVNGIPQGSILSPVLCHLYFGHVENTLFHNYYESRNSTFPSDNKQNNVSSFVEEEDIRAEQAKLGWWKRSIASKTHPQTMILRLMDDYLIISTQPSCVQYFLQTLCDSYGDYGGKINPLKTKVNFPVTLRMANGTDRVHLEPPWDTQQATTDSDKKNDSFDTNNHHADYEMKDASKNNNNSHSSSSNLNNNDSKDDTDHHYRTSDTKLRQFTWCGLIIDTTNMEIRPDLSRLLSRSLMTSVSIESTHPGIAFRRAIKSFFRMKCHALVLDTQMYRQSTVLQSLCNLYQLTAARSFAYYQRLYRLFQVHLRAHYLLRCIREGILFAARLIASRMRREISRKLHLDDPSAEAANAKSRFDHRYNHHHDDSQETDDYYGEEDESNNSCQEERSNNNHHSQSKHEESAAGRKDIAPLVTHFGDCAVSVKMAVYLGWKAFRDVAVATHFRIHPKPSRRKKRSAKTNSMMKNKSHSGDQSTKNRNSNYHAQHLDMVACCTENLAKAKLCLSNLEWEAIEQALVLFSCSEDSQLSNLPIIT